MARRKRTHTPVLDNAPHNPTWRQVMIKTFVGLIVGTLIAFLTFIVLVLVKGIIDQALADSLSGDVVVNPLLPLILMVIAFLGTFIGNIIIAWVLNLVYTTKYYDMSKMFTVTLLMNILLFLFFIPIYLLFIGNLTTLFMILAMHVLLTVFLCYIGIEATTNPNYAASHMVWWAWGLAVAIFCFALASKVLNTTGSQQVGMLLSLPPVLAYFFIPLFQSIREKVYYKFYSMWNNFLYIPSMHEVTVDAEDSSAINVDLS